MPAQPARTIKSASETCLPPFAVLLKAIWIPPRVFSTLAICFGWVTSQPVCGDRRIRAPFAPPLLSEPRNVDADAQAVETSWDTDSPEAIILPLRGAMSFSPINL